MCFSHANRLPFRLTFLAGGVQSNWLCQTDVFDALISIVMFPRTSFWGKPWWFRTPIAFSASFLLFQMLPFAYWTYKSLSSFGLRKQLTVFPFLISGLFWKIGDSGHRSPYLSHAKRALYHLSYIPVEEMGSYCLIKPFLCYWNSWTESSFAYRSNIGFVDAGHQSMCFSNASRLPSVLTCLAGGVQRGCLFQTDVFDSLISIVMFPPTSLWGKSWWFETPIAFSGSSVLFQMLPFHIARTNVQILVLFWSNKTASRISFFFCFRTPLKNWRCGASIPVPLACKAGALPSELHPRWGNGELLPHKPFLCFWNSWTESSIAYRCNIDFVDAGYQSMCFSHASRLPSLLTWLAGGVQRSCLCQTDVFDSLISIVMFPPTSFWGKPGWFGTPIAFWASCVLFQMLPFLIGRTNPCLLLV